MCGLIGMLNVQGSPEQRLDLCEQMLAQITHRGPDAWGTYVDPDFCLGHVRLSIVDVQGGHQPMALGPNVLAFNGEVFNHPELRGELEAKGERFKTTSDTEVLLRALERWGTDTFQRLNGQMAALYWNSKSKRLLVARDRFGIRPLYILSFAGALYFSSELKAFDVIPGFDRKFHAAHLLQHGLLWNTLGSDTVYENIHCVEAGTFEEYDATQGCLRTARYHQLGDSPGDGAPETFEEAQEVLRDKLAKAVSLRLRSDVPVANYLSGGIDSSVIAHLTDKLRSDRFQTFSIAFQDAEFDESPFQREMAAELDTDPFTLSITRDDIDANFEDVVRHAERPLFRTAPVPLYLLSKEVQARGIRVVLTGEAADEILWGYDSFKELKLLRFWSRQPKSKMRPQLLRRLYPHLAHYSDPKRFGLMRMFYEGFLDSHNNSLAGLNIRVHNNRVLGNYFRKEHRDTATEETIHCSLDKQLPGGWAEWSLLQRNQFLEMRSLLQGYLLSSQGDRMSLAHGVEGRYPFLDHELVEWLFHLPDEFKLKLLSQKHLLRESFRGRIPTSIIDRPKQPYQAPDLPAFFPGGKLSERARPFLSDESITEVGIFEPSMVRRFLGKWSRGIPDTIGYRDNMLICFLLSTQIAAAHARAPRNRTLDPALRTVTLSVG